MKLEFTKAEFRELAFSIKGSNKDIQEPIIELHPNNTCIYNGIKYKVTTTDKVILERL